MPEQRYRANDQRKDFMVNRNENDLQHPGIKLRPTDSQSRDLPIELTRKLKEVNNPQAICK
jgi:hypothetical protein